MEAGPLFDDFKRVSEIGRKLARKAGKMESDDLRIRWLLGYIVRQLPRKYGDGTVRRFAEAIGWSRRLSIVYECLRAAETWTTPDAFEEWLQEASFVEGDVVIPPPWAAVQRSIRAYEDPAVYEDDPGLFDHRNARIVENAANAMEQTRDAALRKTLAQLLAETIQMSLGQVEDLSPVQRWLGFVVTRPCPLTGDTEVAPLEIVEGFPFTSVPVSASYWEEIRDAKEENLERLNEGFRDMLYYLLTGQPWPTPTGEPSYPAED